MGHQRVRSIEGKQQGLREQAKCAPWVASATKRASSRSSASRGASLRAGTIIAASRAASVRARTFGPRFQSSRHSWPKRAHRSERCRCATLAAAAAPARYGAPRLAPPRRAGRACRVPGSGSRPETRNWAHSAVCESLSRRAPRASGLPPTHAASQTDGQLASRRSSAQAERQ